MTPNHSEIVIVGAGPAGCATSMFLSKAGIHHTIIDKAQFPRDKVCGDALSGKVVYVLKELNNGLLEEFTKEAKAFLPSWGVKFIAPNGKSIDIPFKSDLSKETHAPGFISKRMDFDHALFQKIQSPFVQVYTETELISLKPHINGINIECKTKTDSISFQNVKMLVGAEGDRSLVGKQLGGIKKDNLHYCAGIRAYYEGVTHLHPQHFIELHFLPELLPGYFWIFPLPNGEANVGAGMLSDTVSKKKINLKADMLKAIANNPNINERFKNAKLKGKIEGWGLPLGSKQRRLSGDHFLLTGDAGSLIDPFTGEGIGNAMYSGMLAAKHIESALKLNRFDAEFNAQYDREFYHKQWDELKLSHTMQKLVKFPWLFNFVVNKAHKNKTLRETISCMFEDLDMRSRLRSPKFYFSLLFNH